MTVDKSLLFHEFNILYGRRILAFKNYVLTYICIGMKTCNQASNAKSHILAIEAKDNTLI